VHSAVEESADIIGVSILSGSHLELAEQLVQRLAKAKAKVPVVFGGIIPEQDFAALRAKGIVDIFTPSDYELIDVMERVMTIVEQHG
jgi:(2R)-ethylmalonyl-CoA mutase